MAMSEHRHGKGCSMESPIVVVNHWPNGWCMTAMAMSEHWMRVARHAVDRRSRWRGRGALKRNTPCSGVGRGGALCCCLQCAALRCCGVLCCAIGLVSCNRLLLLLLLLLRRRRQQQQQWRWWWFAAAAAPAVVAVLLKGCFLRGQAAVRCVVHYGWPQSLEQVGRPPLFDHQFQV
jgi:hypothetical protein